MKQLTRSILLLIPLIAVPATPALSRTSHVRHSAAHGLVGGAAARRAARHSVHGRVLSSKLENEDGKLQYAVIVRKGRTLHEVAVDAHTGRVLAQEVVTAAEEAKEAAEDAKKAAKPK